MTEEDDEKFDPLRYGDTYGRIRGERVRVTKRAARRRCTGSLPENQRTLATRERPGTQGKRKAADIRATNKPFL